MERNVNYMIVGFVVLAVLAGIIFFASWVIGGLDKNNYKRYTILFEDAVSGLSVNSPVNYKGVGVGQVTDIQLAPGKANLVIVNIKVREQTPVESYTQVSLGLAGITGQSSIALNTPNGEASPPEMIEPYPYPVLRGDSQQLGQLLEDVPHIASNVLDITNKLNSALDSNMLDNLRTSADNMRTLSEDLKKLVSNKNIDNVSKTLKNIEQVTNDVASLSDSFSKTLDETAGNVDSLISQLGKTVEESEEHLERLSDQGLDQIMDLARESEKMAKEIRQLADSIEDDPSQLIYKQPKDNVDIAQ